MYTGWVSLPFLQLVQFSLRKDPQQLIYHVQVPFSFTFLLCSAWYIATRNELRVKLSFRNKTDPHLCDQMNAGRS